MDDVAAAQSGNGGGEAALPQPGCDRISPVDTRCAGQRDGDDQEGEVQLRVHGGLQGFGAPSGHKEDSRQIGPTSVPSFTAEMLNAGKIIA